MGLGNQYSMHHHFGLQYLLPHLDNDGKEIYKPNYTANNHIYPQIVVSKLRQQTAMAHDRRHFKAAKVTIFYLFLLRYSTTFCCSCTIYEFLLIAFLLLIQAHVSQEQLISK